MNVEPPSPGPELAESRKVEVSDNDIEDWENKLEECFQGLNSHVCD